MIFNSMYNKADYSKRYCIAGPLADHAIFALDGGMVMGILLEKEHWSQNLPPYDKLTCSQFAINGYLQTTDGAYVYFNIQRQLGDGTYVLRMCCNDDITSGRWVVGQTTFLKSSDTFRISIEQVDQDELIWVVVVPPFQEVLTQIKASSGVQLDLATGQISSPEGSFMLSVKCAKEG